MNTVPVRPSVLEASNREGDWTPLQRYGTDVQMTQGKCATDRQRTPCIAVETPTPLEHSRSLLEEVEWYRENYRYGHYELRVRRMIQQVHPFTFLSKTVHINHREERSPANHIVPVIISQLIRRYREGQLDVSIGTLLSGYFVSRGQSE